MTILCPTCHAKKTRGFLSLSSVKRAMENPKCLEQGFSKEMFDVGSGRPIIKFAGSTVTNCPTPIMIGGVPIFTIKEPEEDGGPFRLSATFNDVHGNNTLTIIDNEWIASSNNWDVVVSAGKVRIYDVHNSAHLV